MALGGAGEHAWSMVAGEERTQERVGVMWGKVGIHWALGLGREVGWARERRDEWSLGGYGSQREMYWFWNLLRNAHIVSEHQCMYIPGVWQVA